MIYKAITPSIPLTQGDIIEDCPLVYVEKLPSESGATQFAQGESRERVLVLTQACDLANTKTFKVQVAIVHETEHLVQAGILKGQTVREQVRRHQVFGWYFLPASDEIPECLVDLRDVHTVPRELLEMLVNSGHRRVTLISPYREHLAQHFGVTYSRIALPEPYATQE